MNTGEGHIYNVIRAAAGGLTGVTVLAGMALSMPAAKADNSAVDNVSVVIPLSCTLGGTVTSHSAEIVGGQKKEDIGTSTLTAYCNDDQGFTIYAIGMSNDEKGNTNLVSSLGSDYDIATGTAEEGTVSSWGMKVSAVATSDVADIPEFQPTTSTGYFQIPSRFTQIASKQTSADGNKGGSQITTTYYVYASGTQPAGTYVGKVAYALTHPYANGNLVTLEDAFAAANKTKQVREADGKSYYLMQDMTSDIVSATNVIGEGSQIQLMDSRDQNIYYATKLEDGKVWMTQNLNLNLQGEDMDAADRTIVLDSSNTDIKEDASLYATGGKYANAGYSQVEDRWVWTPLKTTMTEVTGWDNTNTAPRSLKLADNYVYSGDNAKHGLVGNYYNWSAAVASNNTSAYSGSTYNNIENSPANSICPKGWRLPTISNEEGSKANSTSEFARLNHIYNGGRTGSGNNYGSGLMAAPLYFARAGYVYSGTLNYAGIYGYYWSSTVYNSSSAYYLVFASGSVTPAGNANRYCGRSVRCVAR